MDKKRGSGLLALVFILGLALPLAGAPSPASPKSALPAARAESLDSVVFYAREGFDPDLIRAVPRPPNDGWTIILPKPGRSLAIRDLGLQGIGRPSPFDLSIEAPRSFTLLCVFEVDQAALDTSGLSILIPKIGQGWTAYLNGQGFHSEFYQGPDGRLKPERSLRNIILPLDKRSLKLGANILSFHIYGDPEDDRTGITGGKGLMLGGYASLANKAADFIDVALIGVYFLFAFYHLVLFLLRPKQKTYLAFGVGAVLFSLYLFARSSSALALIADTASLRLVEYSALFLIFPVFVAFCEVTLGRRVSWFSWAYIGLGLVLGVLLHFFRVEAIKYVWEGFTALLIVYVLGIVLVPDFVAKVRRGEGGMGLRLGRALVQDSGLLFLGTFIVALTSSLDVVLINSGGDLTYTKYSFLVYIIGTAAILAGQFSGVYSNLAALRHSLERKVAERNAELEAAVEKQKRLGLDIEDQRKRLLNAKDMAERDLLIAEKVQRGFFPSKPPAAKSWDLAMAFNPAAGLSGDFFDFFVSEDYEGGLDLTGLALGDVEGAGMGPGLVAVLARSLIFRRWFSLRAMPLGLALGQLDKEIRAELGGVAVPLSCALLRMDGDKVEYANAASPDLLLLRSGAREARAVLPKGGGAFKGPPLGLEEGGDEKSWASLRFATAPGDLFFLGTSGLEAATNPAGRAFGRQGLLDSLAAARGGSAQEVLDKVLADLTAFREGEAAAEDLTSVVLIRK